MVDDFDAMRRRVKIRRIIKELLRAGVLLGLGIVFMPLLAQVLGLAMYGDILQALREPQFDAWLLVLAPYFIVTVIRLQRSIRKYLEEHYLALISGLNPTVNHPETGEPTRIGIRRDEEGLPIRYSKKSGNDID